MSLSRKELLRKYCEPITSQERQKINKLNEIEERLNIIDNKNNTVTLINNNSKDKPNTIGFVIKCYLENEANKMRISKNKKKTVFMLKKYMKEKNNDIIRLKK